LPLALAAAISASDAGLVDDFELFELSLADVGGELGEPAWNVRADALAAMHNRHATKLTHALFIILRTGSWTLTAEFPKTQA
jgi:hypothetical protein